MGNLEPFRCRQECFRHTSSKRCLDCHYRLLERGSLYPRVMPQVLAINVAGQSLVLIATAIPQ
jgi:hypothetical protein